MYKTKKISTDSFLYDKKKDVSSKNTTKMHTVDERKASEITKKITKINRRFEILIHECATALQDLTTSI